MADTWYSRCDVVWALPPPTNNEKIAITKTKGGHIGKHPIIVLSADASARTITGVMVQSFGEALNLASSNLAKEKYKWFIPITPAIKEDNVIFEPLPPRPREKEGPEWVNVVDIVTIEKDKIKKGLGNVTEDTIIAIENAIATLKKMRV